MNQSLMIRTACAQDLPAMRGIYNAEVTGGTATFDLTIRSEADRQAWFDAHNVPGEGHPLLAAVLDGRTVGYASLSSYRQKEAYRGTVELSVYVADDCRHEGIGTALMSAILAEARSDPGIHAVVSVITEGNTASERLHEKFGFTFCGRIPEVGRKFGRYIGIVQYVLLV